MSTVTYIIHICVTRRDRPQAPIELFMRHMDLKQTGFQRKILKYLQVALKLQIVL